MSSVALLTRKHLSEYARRPINVVLLVVVPATFAVLASGALADFARIVGGVENPSRLTAPSAGWAAAFIAGVAGFFHVLGSRAADQRLAASGFGAPRIVAARLISGLLLSLLAAAAALAALTARIGLADPLEAIAGTVMFAVTYLAIGSAVGAMARSEINGSLVVIFVWMVDVFLGPAMNGGEVAMARVFPTHFATQLLLGLGSEHAGPIGDLGWALLWTFGSVVLAAAAYGHTLSDRGVRRAESPATRHAIRTALRFGLRDYRRNTAMWVLLAGVPIFFITLSLYTTPDQPAPVLLIEQGISQIQTLSMVALHGAIMVPITVAALAGLAGLFVVQGSLEADSRLVIAGLRPRQILAARLGVVGAATLLVTAVSLLVTSIGFTPQSWTWFTVGNLLVAGAYGMLGVVAGIVFGRLGGLYLMFLIPFLDIGVAQNVMFSAAAPRWGTLLPAHGSVRILIDAAFTPTMDDWGGLLIAAGWLVLLGLVAGAVFSQAADPSRA